jgi:hypothetical protein
MDTAEEVQWAARPLATELQSQADVRSVQSGDSGSERGERVGSVRTLRAQA